jgi:hypothetical protein
MGKGRRQIWAARLLIGLVLAVNVQCAIAFLIAPERFAPGFELEGAPGAGMVRGMGILFLMWNVPYALAVSNPLLRRVSLIEATAMQTIGLAGETLLLASFPIGHAAIRDAVTRFAAFDAAGLAALLLAVWLVRQVSRAVAESPSGRT